MAACPSATLSGCSLDLRHRLAIITLLGGMATGLGCQEPTADPAVIAKLRKTLLLQEEPNDAQAVVEVREALLGTPVDEGDAHEHAEHAHDEHAHDDPAHDEHAHGAPVTSDRELNVTMVGSVGGLPNPAQQSYPDFPFDKRKAIVFLADPAVVAHLADEGHQHAPGEECAFCAAHAEDSSAMLAVVRFHDEKGRVAGVDVRDLFDLKGMETVVVQGKAKIEAGMLVVDAKGLYVRR